MNGITERRMLDCLSGVTDVYSDDSTESPKNHLPFVVVKSVRELTLT